MTRTTKWFTVPALSIGALGIAFSAGIFVDHTAVAQAQFVPRAEYTEFREGLRERQFRDSIVAAVYTSEIIKRLDTLSLKQARMERVTYRVGCRLFPKDCD